MEELRKTKIKYIKDNLGDVEDEDIDKIYDNMVKLMKDNIKDKNKLDRVDKMKYILKNLMFINSDNINVIKEIGEKSIECIESDEEKKHRIVLEIINKVLEAMQHNKIKNLCDFVDIKREYIFSDKVKKVIENNKKYIRDNGFKKLSIPHFSIIKEIIQEIGYEIVPRIKSHTVNNKKKVYTVYTIIKSENCDIDDE